MQNGLERGGSGGEGMGCDGMGWWKEEGRRIVLHSVKLQNNRILLKWKTKVKQLLKVLLPVNTKLTLFLNSNYWQL